MKPSLTTQICGIPFKNPLIAASGTCGFGREFAQYYPPQIWGGLSLKGMTLHPRAGNANPRIAETPLGMLNSVGLQNPGVDAFLTDELPNLATWDVVRIANIAGDTVEDMIAVVEKLRDTAVDMVELNISCPNVKAGGMAFGIYPESVEATTRAVKRACQQPLIVKLSPNVADIAQNARAAERAGADAISLINTLTGMAIDPIARKPILARVTGGLSGPAIKPVALRMVYEAAHAVDIPVIGMGGIASGCDVAEFLLAGASAVMIGTANIADPLAGPHILAQFESFLADQGISDARELVGALAF